MRSRTKILFPQKRNVIVARCSLKPDQTPENMHNNNNINVTQDELPNAFADFFGEKIQTIVNSTQIDPTVYNGSHKVDTNDANISTLVKSYVRS